jgi:WD40 repeat protein
MRRKIPGMLATCAVDKTVTLWDTYSFEGTPSTNPPHPCGNKNMGVGKLYTMSFYPSSPWLLGCGGSGKELALWDLSSETALQNRFGRRIGGPSTVPLTVEETEKGSKEKDFKAIMANRDATVEKG